MQVTFQYTYEDLLALQQQWSWFRRWEALLWILGLLLLVMLLVSIAPAVFGHWTFLAMMWGFTWLVVAVFLGILIRRQRRKMTNDMPEVTLELEEDFWVGKAAGIHARHDYSTLLRISETSEYLFIFIPSNRAYVIHNRSFDSPRHRQQFVAELRRHMPTPIPPEGRFPRWPLTEPDLVQPGRDVMQVDAQLTLAEVIDLHRNAFNPKLPKRNSFFLLLNGLILLLLGILATRFERIPGEILIYIASTLLAFTVAALVYVRLFAWRFKKDVSPVACYPFRLAISPRGVTRCTATTEETYRWEDFARVQKSDEYLVIHDKPPGGNQRVVPARAFANASDFEKFAAQVETYVDLAQKQDVVVDAEFVPDPDNPFRPVS